MNRRTMLKLLVGVAAAPIVAPFVPSAPPAFITQRKIYARVLFTQEMLDDCAIRLAQPQTVLIAPKAVIDAYNALVAAEERRFDWQSLTYQVKS